MLDELGSCERNPPALLGSVMASSSWRRRPLGPYRRRAPFRSRETDFRDSRRTSWGTPRLPKCRHSADISALQGAASASNSLETLNTSDGYCRVGQCRMRSVLDNDGWDRVERLVAELRAVERWDADYWRNIDPRAYEMFAFVARRKRRAEVLSQLLTLIPRLDIYAKGHQCSFRKSSQGIEGTFVSRGSSGKLK